MLRAGCRTPARSSCPRTPCRSEEHSARATRARDQKDLWRLVLAQHDHHREQGRARLEDALAEVDVVTVGKSDSLALNVVETVDVTPNDEVDPFVVDLSAVDVEPEQSELHLREVFAVAPGLKLVLMREVNRHIRSRSAPCSDEPISLFCECLVADCYPPVWLTTDLYDTIEADPTAWVLADGHEAVQTEAKPSPWQTSDRRTTVHALQQPELSS